MAPVGCGWFPPAGAADVDDSRLGVLRVEAGRLGRGVSASQLTGAAGRGKGGTRAAALLAV